MATERVQVRASAVTPAADTVAATIASLDFAGMALASLNAHGVARSVLGVDRGCDDFESIFDSPTRSSRADTPRMRSEGACVLVRLPESVVLYGTTAAFANFVARSVCSNLRVGVYRYEDGDTPTLEVKLGDGVLVAFVPPLAYDQHAALADGR